MVITQNGQQKRERERHMEEEKTEVCQESSKTRETLFRVFYLSQNMPPAICITCNQIAYSGEMTIVACCSLVLFSEIHSICPFVAPQKNNLMFQLRPFPTWMPTMLLYTISVRLAKISRQVIRCHTFVWPCNSSGLRSRRRSRISWRGSYSANSPSASIYHACTFLKPPPPYSSKDLSRFLRY